VVDVNDVAVIPRSLEVVDIGPASLEVDDIISLDKLELANSLDVDELETGVSLDELDVKVMPASEDKGIDSLEDVDESLEI